MNGAPFWLAANWWNYVPLALLTIYAVVALYRVIHPLASDTMQGPTKGRGTPTPTIAVNRDPPLPTFATSRRSNWQPDTTFLNAMLYLHKEAQWGQGRGRTTKLIRDTLLEALASSRITSWGRAHPDEPEYQILPRFWILVDVTLESNCVFSRTLNAAAYEVRLCRAELTAMWPPIAEASSPAPA